jgi:hypothetical protein
LGSIPIKIIPSILMDALFLIVFEINLPHINIPISTPLAT